MSHSLRLELAAGELLVVQLSHPCQIYARSGAHWLTIDGLDICLQGGDTVQLPAGKLLLEGRGQLEMRPGTNFPQCSWLSIASHFQTA
ncbi:hypothetical protein [Aquitalea sp. LB_tupeE]|uniref:hypothetical protein n=1 Tax=Aquitalea sp. LB_tupeE TaxID=2748078 RepID=UPI0015BCD503|nr:hypothetical protein [Aquitalea sp. LB_tupeE]NWK78569.1 hypothetical protein [Aquitalea sp. LB_tupeE]